MISVGIVDRTGVVAGFAKPAAASRGLDVELHDVGPVWSFGPDADRYDVVVLGERELTVSGLRRVARYSAAHPATMLVAVGVPAGRPTDDLRVAGVSIVSRGLPSRTKLASVLEKATADLQHLYAETAPRIPTPRPYNAVAQAVEEHEREAQEQAVPDQRQSEPQPSPDDVGYRGVLLTVASATGGCGKTFFATNLAAVCARTGRRVLLVDLDLQFGEVAAALRVRHPYSVYDGLYDASGSPLPAEQLSQHLPELVYHHHLGFDVLTAPKDPVLADYVGARDALKVLDAVLPRYDIVVVDTPPSLNEVVLTALDRSDVVAVLATLDVPSLKNLGVFLDTLRRLHVSDHALRLVINKVESDIGIDVKQAQDAFNDRFVGRIPLARSVSRAINAGTVVVDLEPRSAVTRQLSAAVSAVLPPGVFTPAPIPKQRKRSRWRRMLSALKPSSRTVGGVL